MMRLELGFFKVWKVFLFFFIPANPLTHNLDFLNNKQYLWILDHSYPLRILTLKK